jgi:hypothetical protein
MYILSLPIPEAEFNYFGIIIVPLTSKVVRKVVFKLPRNAVVVKNIIFRKIIALLFKRGAMQVEKTSFLLKLCLALSRK